MSKQKFKPKLGALIRSKWDKNYSYILLRINEETLPLSATLLCHGKGIIYYKNDYPYFFEDYEPVEEI